MHLIDAAWSGHLSWTKCSKTLARLRDDLTSEDLDAHALLSELCQPAAWPFLRKSRHGSEDAALGSLQDWERRAGDLVAGGCLPACIPRPISKHRVLLHAFSGRRRRGDVEWLLDATGCLISVVSLDIVSTRSSRETETRSLWLHAILQGWVTAFLGGPPCNTWAARDMCSNVAALGSLGRWTSQGLASLRLKELEQILMGNLLSGFALECMTLLALCCRAGILEHSKEPEPDHMVSMWRLPVMQLISCRTCGWSRSRKGCLVLRAPNQRHCWFLDSMALKLTLEPDVSPRTCHMGPLWVKTRQVNTGPRRWKNIHQLCAEHAESFYRDLIRQGTGSEIQAPSPFLQLVQHMKDHDFGCHIGHDGWFVHEFTELSRCENGDIWAESEKNK